jgi:hypothetical protein
MGADEAGAAGDQSLPHQSDQPNPTGSGGTYQWTGSQGANKAVVRSV